MYNEILATNDVSTSVCWTRVPRSSWKIVSHPSSTSSVKGNGEQVWLTQVSYLVRRGPEECNTLGMLEGQAWLTRVSCFVRLVPEKFAMSHSGAMSLGDPR